MGKDTPLLEEGHRPQKRYSAAEDDSPVVEAPEAQNSVNDLYKSRNSVHIDLALVSLAFMLYYGSATCMKSLQTSLYPNGGLGAFVLVAAHGMSAVSSVLAPAVITTWSPKWILVVALFAEAAAILANVYPNVYLLLTTAAIAGFFLGLAQAATNSFVLVLANQATELAPESDLSVTIKRFWGVHEAMKSLSFVIMPLSAVILSIDTKSQSDSTTAALHFVGVPRTRTDFANNTSCGADFCPVSFGLETMKPIQSPTMLICAMIYVLMFLMLSAILAALLLKPARLSSTVELRWRDKKKEIFSFFRGFTQADMMFLIVIPKIWAKTNLGLTYGIFMSAYTTCPFGIHFVGYAMSLSLAGKTLFSWLSGCLSSYVTTNKQLVFVGLIQISCLVTMLEWKPGENQVVITFLLMVAFGAVDAIVTVQQSSLIGILFPEQRDVAYSWLNFCRGVGIALPNIYGGLVCVRYSVYISGALFVAAVCSYIGMLVIVKNKRAGETDKAQVAHTQGTAD